jgi:hypothetical protein
MGTFPSLRKNDLGRKRRLCRDERATTLSITGVGPQFANEVILGSPPSGYLCIAHSNNVSPLLSLLTVHVQYGTANPLQDWEQENWAS